MKNIKTKVLGFALAIAAALGVAMPQAAVFADKNIDIHASDYGYGEYTVIVKGTGFDGVFDEDYVTFYYYPVYAEASKNDEIGGFDLNLEYSADDGTIDTGAVAKMMVNVYDSNGQKVRELSSIKVLPPTTHIELPFEQYGLSTGTYTIKITAYDKEGNKLYKDYELEVYYEAPYIPAPNTGGIMGNLNISNTDYLITGITIFGIVAIAGVVFITKNDKKRSTRRRK